MTPTEWAQRIFVEVAEEILERIDREDRRGHSDEARAAVREKLLAHIKASWAPNEDAAAELYDLGEELVRKHLRVAFEPVLRKAMAPRRPS